MKVLVADDDAVARAVLVKLLELRGYTCVVAQDGDQAWAILSGEDAPRIVFVDWMMPGVEGPELCRRIRDLGRASYTYIVLVSTRSRQQDVDVGFDAGIDAFITKPFRAGEVFSRLAVAHRLLARTSDTTLRFALREATQCAGGDVVVRSGKVVGRIMFHEGQVAWAHVSDEPGSLHAMLGQRAITGEQVKGVLEEAAETGRNFAEVIVEHGLLSEEALIECMRRWIAQKVARIAGLPEPAVLFIPEDRHYGGCLFDLDEVFVLEGDGPPVAMELHRRAVPMEAPSTCDPDVEYGLSRILAIDGAVSAAIFDASTGECLGCTGQPIDLDLAWRKIRIAASDDVWEDVEDVILTTARHHYLMRPIHRERLLFLVTDRNYATLGLVRVRLDACCKDDVYGQGLRRSVS